MKKVRKLNRRILPQPKLVPPHSKSSLAEDLDMATDRSETVEQDVQVIYGAGVHQLPLVGLTVAQARELAGTILEVNPGSRALVNGQLARPSRVIAVGDMLEFVHHAGEKGAASGRSG